MATDYAGPQVSIGNGQTINATVAPYLAALTAAVLADPAVVAAGITTLTYTEGTRTWARQNYLFVNQGKPGFNPAYSPDRPSDHQWGNAIDFGSGAGYAGTPVQLALHRLGPIYGFSFPIKNELWHGVCDPATAQPLPAPTLPEEEDMIDILLLKAPQERGIFGSGFNQKFKDTSEMNMTLGVLKRAPTVRITEVTVTALEFARIDWATQPDDLDTIKNRK
ncbi:M15 family metallopeptidase [Frigoribacterium faeni]|uniref:Uncharacterized protein n=1 Tax=Frigoribacterium faeni TaxID=145483 RepID=A0A7W3JGL4_9MICO|nr:M15 family metallopeptidase [Frigoribacterium faeni]MBA8812434.1 hypothetical protein [Frigoribacterium faeni]BFF13507.1 hypothetical protein GCM10025699_48100 [Microbacterium flavescens]GEK81849.1 hypothetical protein FFA01_01580 [Frigoribacterium faeni]